MFFGLLAVFIVQVWLNNQANMWAKNIEPAKTAASQTVVVAKQPLRFGTELNASMLQKVPWPSDAPPSGAFGKIHDIMSGGRRIVLAEATQDHGSRPTHDAVSLVTRGMKAVTIRVNDVEGGGFALPGDHVDIVLTRRHCDAQKLWLASSVGSLSLLLRKAGETAEVRTRKVTLQDLSTDKPVADKGTTTTVVVRRAAAKQEYTVLPRT